VGKKKTVISNGINPWWTRVLGSKKRVTQKQTGSHKVKTPQGNQHRYLIITEVDRAVFQWGAIEKRSWEVHGEVNKKKKKA